jgi:hypothetical protein
MLRRLPARGVAQWPAATFSRPNQFHIVMPATRASIDIAMRRRQRHVAPVTATSTAAKTRKRPGARSRLANERTGSPCPPRALRGRRLRSSRLIMASRNRCLNALSCQSHVLLTLTTNRTRSTSHTRSRQRKTTVLSPPAQRESTRPRCALAAWVTCGRSGNRPCGGWPCRPIQRLYLRSRCATSA